MNSKRIICIRWTGLGLIQLLFSVVFSIPAYSQLRTENLTRYSELNGLPALQVEQTLVDRQGYIWVGTINGLAKYDGYTFKRFFNNPNDPGSIKGLQVWSLFEDRGGQIWVSTGPGNLNIYNSLKRSFSQIEFTHLIEHPATTEIGITSMAQDDNGRIYFGVSSNFGEPITSGLLYKEENESEIHFFPMMDSIPGQNVVYLQNIEGNIWIVSYAGIFIIDSAHHIKRIENLDAVFKTKDDLPVRMISGEEGHVWILTARANLVDFNPSMGSYKMYTPDKPHLDQHRNVMVSDGKDHLWIGTTHDLSRFNVRTKKFEHFNFNPQHPLNENQIMDLRLDGFGNIWIGTASQGLFKYEERAIFRSFNNNKEQKNSLTEGWVNNIYESRNGKIYISTFGSQLTGGLNILDADARNIISIPYTKLSTIGILGFIEFSPNEFYLGTYNGIFKFSAVDRKVQKVQWEGLPSEVAVFNFKQDQKNNLWLGTNRGLFRKENNQLIKYDLSKLKGANASSNEITGIYESKKYGIWLMSNNGLFLYRYSIDKIERYGFDPKEGDVFVTQDINSFYEDSSGIAWVGNWQGGLNKFNPEKRTIKTYTLDDGLPSMSIQSILPDEKTNSLWLSTFEGLSHFNMNESSFYNYSISDGIQGQLFADGAGLKTSKGLFIFGGSNGITVFDPTQINSINNPPKVFLTDFKLFNKSILPGENSILKKPIDQMDEVTLKSTENNISLEFAVIHYSDPTKNKSQYRLENYETEWRTAGEEHLAFYPKLAPGQYLFRVKAANNNGIWNEEGAALKITILQPWWNTTWAYFLYALILVIMGLSLNRYMRKRILKKQQEEFQLKQLEQAKIIEKAYGELGQAHETLKATQTQLIQSEKMASLGELTAGIAHEIQNPLNFVNNFSEVNKELIEELNMERGKIKGERNEKLEQELFSSLKDNFEKITHHGKRAEAIVKNMLQHSRKTSSQKEWTDINALADEYLRLSYHGLKAKDNTFNATIKTDLDPAMGKVFIIPQDIGRVILNLLTNAFYAVSERNHPIRNSANEQMTDLKDPTMAELPSSETKDGLAVNYTPIVSLSTKKVGENIEIRISDNGNGIPKEVINKIYQPFFTTKPSGQGTGLGLSLSYDLIKAHQGSIEVITQEGKGTEFIIKLPVQ